MRIDNHTFHSKTMTSLHQHNLCLVDNLLFLDLIITPTSN